MIMHSLAQRNEHGPHLVDEFDELCFEFGIELDEDRSEERAYTTSPTATAGCIAPLHEQCACYSTKFCESRDRGSSRPLHLTLIWAFFQMLIMS